MGKGWDHPGQGVTLSGEEGLIHVAHGLNPSSPNQVAHGLKVGQVTDGLTLFL